MEAVNLSLSEAGGPIAGLKAAAAAPPEETLPPAGAPLGPETVAMAAMPTEEEPRAAPRRSLVSARRTGGRVFHHLLTRFKDHWRLIVAAAVLVVVLVILVIAIVVPLRNSAANKPAPAIEMNSTEDQDTPKHCQCEVGWFQYKGMCFFFSEDEGNWPFANNTCASRSSCLAVFKSNEEKDFALSKTQEFFRWVGMRKAPDGKWMWLDGSTLASGTVITGGSDCAYLNHVGFSSAKCSFLRRYICTKPEHCVKK